MTDFDLERLGDVWRQQPDPAEMARLQRSASAVARRARLASTIDILGAVAVAAVVIVLVALNPRIQTLAVGAAAILVLLGGNIRLRRLRRIELRGLTGTTETMLDQSIERVETSVRHNRFTLWAMAPALVFGYALAAILIPHRDALFGRLGDAALARLLWSGGWVVIALTMALFFARGARRGGRELDRLRKMREAYRQEGEAPAE